MQKRLTDSQDMQDLYACLAEQRVEETRTVSLFKSTEVNLVCSDAIRHCSDIIEGEARRDSWTLRSQPADRVDFGTPCADVSVCNHSLRMAFGAGSQKEPAGFSQEVNREVMCRNSWCAYSPNCFIYLSIYLSLHLFIHLSVYGNCRDAEIKMFVLFLANSRR